MRSSVFVSLFAVAIAAAVATANPAWASYPSGSVGHDVSYPQCTSSGASTTTVGGLQGAFGLVGVTGGRPWGSNSCAAAEVGWAANLPNAPGLYMNTANPAPTSSYYWPASGTSDPALCQNAASTTDPGCAYDYGWHAAADALTNEAKNITNAAGFAWWLDVETANSWNGDGTSNAADLQGSIDYLRSHGVPSVGLYATSSQWTSITGGYSTTTAASYANAWAPEFTAQYPMTTSPVWVAGLGSASSASTNCTTSFTGGPTWLAQYNDGSGYDADLACDTTAVTTPTAPQNLTATGQDSAVKLSWSPPASTGGTGVTYNVYRGTSPGGEASTPIATGLAATSYTDSGLANGTPYYYLVRAVNSAGTSPTSNEVSATPAPLPQSFTLTLSPTSGSVKRGRTATSTVSITDTGAAQTVTPTASNLPPGVTASFTPTSRTGTGTSTLTLVVSWNATRGTYPISITGTGTTGMKTATYTLTVR
jgi:hypothetical protein